ncbi:low molecular weight protein-tyrosine-phosphatase [Mariprofundus ferrooxydans]|uniref:low molecular weight protein-tyrosine-phosphatase n=1 Tax=Mariprofundus ferrooxydans TaxID=314344 RepID=UPI0002F59AAA|nr:low molecular weight protein-tyrosine-phosphatase [Mariprofundus ferrooxydans]
MLAGRSLINRILVLCVGNICRSPFAEALLAKALPKASIDSAGLGALVGDPAAKEMQQAAKAYGVDISAHRGRQLFRPQLEAADMVFVMEKNQKEHLQTKYPHMYGRVFLISHFSQGAMKGKDVADPYRKSQQDFNVCAQEIALHVEAASKVLAPMIKEVVE